MLFLHSLGRKNEKSLFKSANGFALRKRGNVGIWLLEFGMCEVDGCSNNEVTAAYTLVTKGFPGKNQSNFIINQGWK